MGWTKRVFDEIQALLVDAREELRQARREAEAAGPGDVGGASWRLSSAQQWESYLREKVAEGRRELGLDRKGPWGGGGGAAAGGLR